MTELKTLKDFDIDSIGNHSIRDLKQEAIEWIKNSTDQAHWLKFFNLTEEELK